MLIRADARAIPLQDACVQCCVTSPPYWGLRDYGITGQLGLESTPDAYVAQLVAVFREVRRVLKDDGTVWLNLGDSYAGGGNYRGVNSENTLTAKQSSNRGARGISQVLGAAGKTWEGMKPKDLVGIPWRVAFALQADGWYLRSDIIWHKPNPMPESVTDRPTKAHEYLFLLTKAERYYYDAEAIAEASTGQDAGNGFKRPERLSYDGRGDETPWMANPLGTRNRRSVWTVNTQPYAGAHFATMPEALVTPCILAGSRGGDLVLDPFSGSGTVLEVANRLGRRSVGCDINPVYHTLAKTRTAQRGLRF
jgi:DNA modification methylase